MLASRGESPREITRECSSARALVFNSLLVRAPTVLTEVYHSGSQRTKLQNLSTSVCMECDVIYFYLRP